MNKTVHQLKTDVEYFRAVASGDKTFEIRFNDRGYQKGDIVHLLPYEGSCYVQPYDGLKFVITYVIGFNQKDNWVVFGIKPLVIPTTLVTPKSNARQMDLEKKIE